LVSNSLLLLRWTSRYNHERLPICLSTSWTILPAMIATLCRNTLLPLNQWSLHWHAKGFSLVPSTSVLDMYTSPIGFSITSRRTHLRRFRVRKYANADVKMVSPLLDGSLHRAERLNSEFPLSELLSSFPRDGSNLRLLWKILYANCENIEQLHIITSEPGEY